MPATAESGWKIKAHRGASFDAVENTIAAVQLAFQQGAHASEIDVRLSADGVPMVFHDEDTMRLAGHDRRVSDQTAGELGQLRLSYGGRDGRISTLSEMLAALPGDRVLFIEIKDGPDAVPAVIEAVVASGKKDSVAIESFEPQVLAAVHHLQPAIPLHLTIGAERDASNRPLPIAPESIAIAQRLGATGVAVDVRGLSRELARTTERAGLELGVWTINDEATAATLVDLNITWLETDRPAIFRQPQ